MEIKNLCKSFGKNIIFDNFNCSFDNGKITFIMGESGVGKTTLLRIISGLDKKYNGEIILKGKIAYVFQEPRLFPTLNLKQNIEIVNDNSHFSINEILDMLELTNASELLPNELSGGMKIRASLGRALYSDADIILMDEPFASLDEDMKDRISAKVFNLLKGKTVIVVSHDASNAKKFADKIINL